MPTDPTTPTTGPRCTCKPPDGVTRNHANHCPLFDVFAAYRQARADERRRLAGLVDAAWDVRRFHSPNEWDSCVACQKKWPCDAELLAELVLTLALPSDTEPAP